MVRWIKCKVHPRRTDEGPEVKYMFSSTLPLISAIDVAGGQHQTPAALPPTKKGYQLNRRLGDPLGMSGWVRKILAPTGIRFPDRLARSESLNPLSYRRPFQRKVKDCNTGWSIGPAYSSLLVPSAYLFSTFRLLTSTIVDVPHR